MAVFFAEDWTKPDPLTGRYPVFHKESRNASFKRMALLYKNMGLKNHSFHMCLYDQDLRTVDPHDPNLSDELKHKIAVECRINVWYYMREVMRIPVDGGAAVPFRADRGNLAMIWCYFNNIDITSTQPRQTGKTVGAIAITSYVIFIYGYRMTMVMFTHNTTLVQGNVKRLKGMRDGLPQYLIRPSKLDIDNKEGLSYERLKNTYLTFIGQKDRNAASNIGRGSTFASRHTDEICFIANFEISYKAMTPATREAKRTAKENGMPHSDIYTTTAGDPSTPSGKFAYNMVTKAMPFTEQLFDCQNNDGAHQMVHMRSTNRIVNATFSHLQLGYDNAWLREQQIQLAAGSGDGDEEVDFERDYLNMWKSGGQFSIISKELLSVMNRTRCEPSYIQPEGDYAINWYIPRNIVESPAFRRRPLVLGMDPSDMIGRDFTSLVLVDPADLRVMATFRCNESNITKLSLFVAQLLIDFSGILFVPENRSTGSAIIDNLTVPLLRAGFNPYQRIFNRVVDEIHTEEMSRINIQDRENLNNHVRRYLGFKTNGRLRDLLYKRTLQKAVQLGADRIFDGVLIDELSGLSTINGRIDHANGAHDDMVIAYLLACYVIFDGKNKHIYGIAPEAVLSSVTSDGKRVDPAHLARQIAMRKEIAQYDQLAAQEPLHSPRRIAFKMKADQLRPYIDHALNLEPVSGETVQNAINSGVEMYRPMTTSQNSQPFGAPVTPLALDFFQVLG